MKNKRLYDIISTMLALNKRKKRDLYNILENIDKEGKTQADYSENNVNSPSYIKNREFYGVEADRTTNYYYNIRVFPKEGNIQGSPKFKLEIDLDFENNVIQYIHYKDPEPYRWSSTQVRKKIIENPIKFRINSANSVIFNDKEYYAINIDNVGKWVDFTIGFGYGNPQMGTDVDMKYFLFVNKDIDINNIKKEDFIARYCYRNYAPLGYYTCYLSDIYDGIDSQGSPSQGATKYNISVSKSSTGSIAYIVYSNYYMEECTLSFSGVYKEKIIDKQLPEEYVYDLTQKVKELEQRVQELEG